MGSTLWYSAPSGAAERTHPHGSSDGTLHVQVERDYLGTGVYDSGIDVAQAGIDVTVSDPGGASVSGTSDATGTITVDTSSLSGGAYRVVGSIPTPYSNYLRPAPASTGAGHFSSMTSFVDVSNGNDVTLTLGVWDPADWAQANPNLAVPVQNAPASGADTRALVQYPYTSRGDPAPSVTDTQAQVGATYGVAYDKIRQRIFQGAFAKRHTVYGPDGAGAIYVVPADGSAAPTLFATVPDVGTAQHDTGNLIKDAAFYDVPGRESLGDVELSEDGRTLYAVNLHTNSLVSFDATLARAPTPTATVAIPDPGCAQSSDWHPFGLGTHNGLLYVGGVCSAQSTGTRGDLKVVVYTYNGTSFTQVLSQPLTYGRGKADGNTIPAYQGQISHWNPWSGTYPPAAFALAYPEPELASISFDRDGSLLLGFRDRYADQLGYHGLDPRPGRNNQVVVHSAGDLNKACRNADGSYSWEGTGGCPNNATPAADGGESAGTTEFFPGEFALGASPAFHQETAQGAVAFAMNGDNVVTTDMDPTNVAWTGGLGFFDRTTGAGPGNDHAGRGLIIAHATQVAGVTHSENGFGKANGLGDLEVLADAAPVQIGNRVWYDANRNGVQDAGEVGLPGATVSLLDTAGAQVARDTTTADGEYYFGGADAAYQLTRGAAYRVKVNACSADTSGISGAPPAADLRFTTPGAGSDSTLDSNVVPPTNGTLCDGSTQDLAAPDTPGTVDHSIDAGLVPPTCSLGDFVFDDVNGNGVQDAGEPGVPNVTVALLDANGDPADGNGDGVPDTTTTDADGHYSLPGLRCTTYEVKFTAPTGDRFTGQGLGGDPGKDSNPDPGTGITPPVTLSPTNPNGGNDPTIDAGLVATVCSVGDFVFTDTDRNGIQGGGEAGVAGTTVTLLDGNADPVPGVAPQVTGNDGRYLFADVVCGVYEVKFTPPAGTQLTIQQAGTDPAKDSNPDPATGVTPPVILSLSNPNNGGNDLTVDAGIVPVTCSIGDFVFSDANGNGVQDSGEPGVPGVTVTLLDGSGRPVGGVAPVITGVNGSYHFTDLPCGTYRVKFTPPAGSTFSPRRQGTDPSKDSNPDPGTGVTSPITVTPAAPDDPTIDAGIIPNECGVGDFVFVDTNRNGIQDDGEPGVAGTVVTLLDPSGAPVPGIDPVTTRSDGIYHFTGLPCGGYKVKFKPPAGDTLTVQRAGDDRSKDSNPNPSTGITPISTVRPSSPVDDTIDAGVIETPIDTCQVDGFVWIDTNHNGVFDAGEPPVAGVVVVLLDVNGQPVPGVPAVRTGPDGSYHFVGLPCGIYRLLFTNLPAGDGFTIQHAPGSRPDRDSDPDPRTGVTDPFTLVAETTPTPVDAGLVPGAPAPVPPPIHIPAGQGLVTSVASGPLDNQPAGGRRVTGLAALGGFGLFLALGSAWRLRRRLRAG